MSKPNSTVMSTGYLGVSQVIRVCIAFLSTIFVARILSPDDFGVIAMTGPVVGFVALFQNLGLSTAAVQARSLSQVQSSSLLWINVIASALVGLILFLISPLVAIFYGDERAGYITAASAAPMLLGGLGAQHSAILQREMRFGALSLVEISTTLATFLATLGLAIILKSYWALFAGSCIGTFTWLTLVWTKSSFRPSVRISFHQTIDLIRVGGNMTGSNIFNFLVRNADSVLIARTTNATELGLYDRSYRLMMMPIQNVNTPLSRVLLPTLSRLRDDGERYRRTYLVAIRGIILVTAPGIAIATALSLELMPALLGSEWADAGPIFGWLGLAGLIQPIANMTGVLYVTSDRTKQLLWWGIFSAATTLIAFLIGVQWGALGIAMAFFWSLALRLPLIFYFATRGVSVKQIDLWSAQMEPLLGCSIAVGIAFLLQSHLPFFVNFVFSTGVAYLLAFLTSCISKDGRDLSLQCLASGRLLIMDFSCKIARTWKQLGKKA